MARKNLLTPPYYDDYNPEKNYIQLMARPGRVAQAREFTTMQSILRGIIKSVGDSIMKDGDIVEGCQVIVASNKKSVTVTAGKVYMDGIVMSLNEDTTINIVGSGVEFIGIELIEEFINEDTDSSLRDPAQGTDNFNKPGCDRLKRSLKVVKLDSDYESATTGERDVAVLTKLIDGGIAVEQYAPNYDMMTETLSRRTYDESGSYIVNGLNARVESNSQTNKFNVIVEAGKAYVKGYELGIPAPRTIEVPRSLTTTSVTRRGYTYSSSSRYYLEDYAYVQDITKIEGTIPKSKSASNQSNVDEILVDSSVEKITSVKQSSTTYQKDVDYSLTTQGNNTYIKWLGNNAPANGTQYEISYTAYKTFVKNTDYELVGNRELVWKNKSTATAHPVDNFTVIYEIYLARKDTVYITPDGDISVILGTPNEYGFELPPDAPLNTLPLATVMSPPAGAVSTDESIKITVANIGLTRFTMEDINRLLTRVRTLEYDQAVLSLDNEAKQYETTGQKKGIFTDSLIDLSKIDFYFNSTDTDSTLPVFDANIDLDSNICYLPVISNIYDATFNSTASTVNKYDRTVTLGKLGESVVLAQTNATKSFLINPYSTFPQLPEISIDPAVDTWYEDEIIEVPVSMNASEVVETSTRNISGGTVRQGGVFKTYSNTSTSTQNTSIGTKVTVTSNESVISEKAVTYIRQRTITVSGSQFYSNADNIVCYFDGVKVDLTPTGTTVSGTASGSVKANSSGLFTATFEIPENRVTGIREVRVESQDSSIPNGHVKSAFTLYQASGTIRSIERTVTTLTTVLLKRVTTTTTTTYVDPVGQTFVLNNMALISAVDLYFAKKPTDNTPVICEIRGVSNGTINSEVYGHKVLSASSVNTSNDSSVATRFTFDDPILLEENTEYAFVVRSTSTQYAIWISELGESDILSKNRVLTNPYMIGTMMSSSNNSSWTVHQTSDVKFRLISDEYATTSEVVFNTINASSNEFSRIYLLADSIVPNGTSIKWSYSIDGTVYEDITPYNINVLNDMEDSVSFKARLTRGDNTNLTPIIALDSVGAVLSSYDSSDYGYYISKNISGLDSYTNVAVIMDTYLPSSGTSISVGISADDGETITWVNNPEDEFTQLDYGWKEFTYKHTLSSSTQCRIFIKLGTSSSEKYLTPSFRRLRVIMS